MDFSGVAVLVLLLLFFLANLPWLLQRSFLFAISGKKDIWVYCLEWLFLYIIAVGLSLAIEKSVTGVIHEKGWEFYSISLLLFLVFSFPGFVYAIILKRRV